jgi:hypothetical protein
MNELFISCSMEIGVMLELDTSTISRHFYSPIGAIAQRERTSVFGCFSDDE